MLPALLLPMLDAFCREKVSKTSSAMFRLADQVRLYNAPLSIAVLTYYAAVPLFWNQPGYSLKPAPALSPDRSREQNLDALKRHLQRLLQRYGPLVRQRYSRCAIYTFR